MSGPHIEQSIEKPIWAKQTWFVELFLLEVVVLVHRLHQGAQHVDGGVADAVVAQLQRLCDLDADLQNILNLLVNKKNTHL